MQKVRPTIPVSPIYFNVAEYCLFGIILGVIVGIIVYYNVVNRKYNTVSGFLFGGKHMSVISITLALIASHLTSITLLGVPVEIYLRGTQYWASALSLIIVTFLTAVIYLPEQLALEKTIPSVNKPNRVPAVTPVTPEATCCKRSSSLANHTTEPQYRPTKTQRH